VKLLEEGSEELFLFSYLKLVKNEIGERREREHTTNTRA
jgi:hypothetical protein